MDKIFETITQVYFHELETRENIFVRLQLNFAFYASFLAVIAYMCRTLDYESNHVVLTIFYIAITFSIYFLSYSIFFTYKSLTGLSYRLITDSNDLLTYRNKTIAYNKEIEEYNKQYGQKIDVIDHNEQILDTLCKCNTFNSQVNEKRKLGIRQSLRYLLLSSIPLLVSASLFIAFDLDASSPRKTSQIEDEKLIATIKSLNSILADIVKTTNTGPIKQKENSQMTANSDDNKDKKQPAPPPPPPPPSKPTWVVSNESFDAPPPRDSTIITEQK